MVKAANRNEQLPVGGKLVHFKDTWTKLFPQHPEIVRKVSQGILIAFDGVLPSLLSYPLELPSNNKAADLLHAVQKLHLSQAIEEVMDTMSLGFFQPPISSPKTRRFFSSHHRLEEVESVHCSSIVQNGNALLNNSSTSTTGMDHKDRLEGRIPSHPGTRQHPQILRVRCSRDSLSIPGPPVWTINSSTGIHQDSSPCDPAASFSRHQVHAYLDDWIIRATSQEQSLEHTQHIIQLIQSLGWTINWDKSMLQTSRILDFLGLHFNLEQALISPPASFLPTLTEVLSRLSPSTLMSARKVSIISRMSHFAPFISSGRLHLRFLQFWFKQQWTQHQQSWDTPIQLDADFLSYLRWFLSPTVMTGVPLHLPDPSLFFFTDASLKGWGASWKDHQISGPWSTQDSQRHINWLELEAVRLALLRWGSQWKHQTVRVYCDNSTAVAYIRKQGEHIPSPYFEKLWNCSNSWISLW